MSNAKPTKGSWTAENVTAYRDALVMLVMRGSHREARDFARAHFVTLCPEERGHAEVVARHETECDRLKAINAELLAALRRVQKVALCFNDGKQPDIFEQINDAIKKATE